MKVSILIVNYNQKYFPRLCVESLQKSKFEGGMEIIFCDNSSKDESLGYLREASEKGDIKLIEAGKNLGYGAGMNLAAKEAKGKYVVVLNADITVEADTLQKMVDYMEKHSEVGMLAPKLVYHNGDVQPSCRRHFRFMDLFIKRTFLKRIWPFKSRYEKYIMFDFNHESVQEVDLVTGAFMMMPRDLYEQVRGFDERYFLFMEDFDLCKKVQMTGKKIVYFPEANAIHYHKRLSDGGAFKLIFNKVSWMHLVSAIKYHWKWRRK